MKNELPALGIFLLLLLLLIGLTAILYSKFHWNSENSRKFLHVTGGILCLFIPRFISSPWTVFFLCSSALALLLYTFLKKQLAAVHKTARKSYGSVLFPVPVYVCFFIMFRTGDPAYYYLPMLLLTFADTSAEIAGKKWGHLRTGFFNKQKTLAGSLAFCSVAITSSFIFFFTRYQALPDKHSFLILLLVSLAATITELVSLKGFDNITMPAVVVLLLFFLRA